MIRKKLFRIIVVPVKLSGAVATESTAVDTSAVEVETDPASVCRPGTLSVCCFWLVASSSCLSSIYHLSHTGPSAQFAFLALVPGAILTDSVHIIQ